jgi:hypothetical protein
MIMLPYEYEGEKMFSRAGIPTSDLILIRSQDKITGWPEDVKEGEELRPLLKGPLGVTVMIAYCIGSAPVPLKASGTAFRD